MVSSTTAVPSGASATMVSSTTMVPSVDSATTASSTTVASTTGAAAAAGTVLSLPRPRITRKSTRAMRMIASSAMPTMMSTVEIAPPPPDVLLVMVTFTASVIGAEIVALVSEFLVTCSPTIEVISPGKVTSTVSWPSEPPLSSSLPSPDAASFTRVKVMTSPLAVIVQGFSSPLVKAASVKVQVYTNSASVSEATQSPVLSRSPLPSVMLGSLMPASKAARSVSPSIVAACFCTPIANVPSAVASEATSRLAVIDRQPDSDSTATPATPMTAR